MGAGITPEDFYFYFYFSFDIQWRSATVVTARTEASGTAWRACATPRGGVAVMDAPTDEAVTDRIADDAIDLDAMADTAPLFGGLDLPAEVIEQIEQAIADRVTPWLEAALEDGVRAGVAAH